MYTDFVNFVNFFLRETKDVHNNVRKWPNYVLLGLTVLGKLIERSTDFKSILRSKRYLNIQQEPWKPIKAELVRVDVRLTF